MTHAGKQLCLLPVPRDLCRGARARSASAFTSYTVKVRGEHRCGTASGSQQEARQSPRAGEGQRAPAESSVAQLLGGRHSRENRWRGRGMLSAEGNKSRPGHSVI